jgi:hypothetical protein
VTFFPAKSVWVTCTMRVLPSAEMVTRALMNHWKREIGDEIQHSVGIRHRFFNGSGRLDWLVRNAANDPGLLRLIIDYSTGATKYKELQRYMMRARVPAWVWSKAKEASGP